MKKLTVLGIETSCDDTGVAVYDAERGLLAHIRQTQLIHAQYGGTVPELASRDHITHLLPLIDSVLNKANCQAVDIDGLAYTAGPGLMGALLVGAAVTHSLAFAWQRPCIGVHHLEGHLMAPFLLQDKPSYPFLALLVSGGHTQLFHVRNFGDYECLGESLDDAAGEAFDKVAKMLDLGYPGGPELAKAAQNGDPHAFQFPRPMCNRPGLDFSFSGLKTAVRTCWARETHNDTNKNNIAAAFQQAVVDTLMIKIQRALLQTGLKNLVVTGGVSANWYLRERLSTMVSTDHINLCIPDLELCTDNGAMIAYAGCQRLLAGAHDPPHIRAKARWALAECKGNL
ncbi:MAG: tRNA N6-adenosine threonylcarbamoyltransferase [marine bacterium B5-7]|nr:MAG: tRNA N6-adenosine threonylcarbamoyltransferase [marine bacterium B5-7]